MLSEDRLDTPSEADVTPVKPGFRLHRPTWASFVVLGLLGVISYNLYFVCHLRQLEYEQKLAELQTMRQDIYIAEFSNKQLRAKVAYLRTNAGVEEVAREKLGLVGINEVAFVVVPPLGHSKHEPPSVPHLPEPVPSAFDRFLQAAFR